MAEKKYDLLCIGNALMDVFTPAGNMVQEDVFPPGLDLPVQHVEMGKITEILSALQSEIPANNAAVLTSGGGAANTAKVAGLLGMKVCFIGAIGQDRCGQIFAKELADAGVELKLSYKTSPTGVCLYCRAGGETRIAASPSAALELSADDICAADISEAEVVVIDGFMLGRPHLVRKILDMADEARTVAAIDLASADVAAEHAGEIFDYVKRYPLILFMNEAEAAAFYKAAFISKTPAFPKALFRRKTSRQFSEMAIKNALLWEDNLLFKHMTSGSNLLVIAVKLGSQGAVVFSGGVMAVGGTIKVIPKENTGAGDAFCAAFLSALVLDKSIRECADFGNRAAGIILGVTGTKAEGKQFTELVRKLRS